MNHTIIDIDDEAGLLDRVEFDPDSLPAQLPLFPSAESDLIYIRPDWPAIGDPRFADRLRAWHAAQNTQIIEEAS
jgi:hypothetical protein